MVVPAKAGTHPAMDTDLRRCDENGSDIRSSTRRRDSQISGGGAWFWGRRPPRSAMN